MKLKNILLLSGLLLPFGNAFAQYAADALKFSMAEHGVTARFRAMGSAQTSLGGDLSSLGSNPAGLGLLTRNELNFTPDFVNSNVSAQYSGSTLTATKGKLGFNQIGAVFHLPVPKRRGSDLNAGWVGFNFGLGYNKVNNYNSDLQYSGVNPKSSFADYLSDLSDSYLGNGNPATNPGALPEGSLENMAYHNFLTEYNASGYFATTGLNNTQSNSVLSTGTQSEINIAAAGNFENRLFVGASISLSSLNFGADREFLESGNTRTYIGQPADFVGGSYTLSYRSAQLSEGSGVNGKLGIIYRATPNVRVGFNFITPTWYHIEDSFSEVLDTRYVRADGSAIAPYTNSDELYDSNYDLRTPYKANIGVSLIGAGGLISGDIEYIDYSNIHFKSSDGVTTNNINRDIAKTYVAAVNARLGGEIKLDKIMLRGGVNLVGNPYKTLDYSSKTFSTGLGYRKNNVYTDFTYAYSNTEYTTKPYAISAAYPDYQYTGSGEAAGITDNRSNFYITFGVRF